MMECSKSLESRDLQEIKPCTEDKSTSTISTIYDPKNSEYPNAKIPLPNNCHSNVAQHPDGGARHSFLEKIKKLSFMFERQKGQENNLQVLYVSTIVYSTFCFLCLLAIVLFGFVQMFNIMFPRKFSRDIIVDGEFQILNRNFDYDMLNKDSVAYKSLAYNITRELDRLFRRSEVSQYYDFSDVLEITPNMTIRCVSLFVNKDDINVGEIGIAFLRSLRLQHGHTWLGQYSINVQSIGFQIRGEEGMWSEWTEWNGCDSNKDYVATRTRSCLTKDTLQPTNVDRCLLIPGSKGSLDIIPCRIYRSTQQDTVLHSHEPEDHNRILN